jgi:serralysin
MARSTRWRKAAISLGTALLAHSISAETGLAQSWHTRQLSDNGQYDMLSRLKDGRVAWTRYDANHDREIFYYDGQETVQLTDNDKYNLDPMVSGGTVVWTQAEGDSDTGPAGKDLMYYNGNGIINLSTFISLPYTEEQAPVIDNGRVVWESGAWGSPGSFEIYSYDGTTFSQITNNSFADFNPQISGSNIVWYGWDGSSYEIYRLQGDAIVPVTDNARTDQYPKISGQSIAWEQYDGHTWQLMFNDGVTTTQLKTDSNDLWTYKLDGSTVAWTQEHNGYDRDLFVFDGNQVRQLTNDAFKMDYAGFNVSGGRVAWSNPDGDSTDEIFLWDGATTLQLTENNGYTNGSPLISEDLVAWLGYDGAIHSIFVYDGLSVYRLTDPATDVTDFQLDGRTIAWVASDGHDAEIFLSTLVPEPQTSLLLLLAGNTLALRRRRTASSRRH